MENNDLPEFIKLLKKLEVVFSDHIDLSSEDVIEAYFEAVDAPIWDVRKGVKLLLETRKDRRFPLPGEINEASFFDIKTRTKEEQALWNEYERRMEDGGREYS